MRLLKCWTVSSLNSKDHVVITHAICLICQTQRIQLQRNRIIQIQTSCCWAIKHKVRYLTTCPFGTFLFPVSHSAAWPLFLRLLLVRTSPQRVHNDNVTIPAAAHSNNTTTLKLMRIMPYAKSYNKYWWPTWKFKWTYMQLKGCKWKHKYLWKIGTCTCSYLFQIPPQNENDPFRIFISLTAFLHYFKMIVLVPTNIKNKWSCVQNVCNNAEM